MGGSLLGAASKIQRGAAARFGGKFESVVAADDFAHKSHYSGGQSCKVEHGGRYAAAWQP